MSFLSKVMTFVSSIKVFFFSIIWLMVLLIIGTIDQREIGIYQAQNIYFSSWYILFWGWLPAPGSWPTLGTISLGLILKLSLKTKYKIKNIGIIVTHTGALILLLGGLITSLSSFEGNMLIEEGETVSYFRDYHNFELVVTKVTLKEKQKEIIFHQSNLRKEQILTNKEIPFNIKIINYYKNTTIAKREKPLDNTKGFNQIFKMNSQSLHRDDLKNIPGLFFKIQGSNTDGRYSIFHNMPVTQSLVFERYKYFFQLRKRRYRLPFKLKLLDFKKTNYASTKTAKSYTSIISLIDESIKQRVVIKMNEPLRYKGYTFYQSSFLKIKDKDVTVISVVNNKGQIIPYISSIIMCIGILMHILITSGILREKKTTH